MPYPVVVLGKSFDKDIFSQSQKNCGYGVEGRIFGTSLTFGSNLNVEISGDTDLQTN
jgi:hypothetical protein